jgi:hypothetical protein
MDMPLWVMGLMCLAVLGLLGLLLILIIVRATSGRRRDPLEDDFDDRPRQRRRD